MKPENARKAGHIVEQGNSVVMPLEKKILLVEDNKMARRALKMRLQPFLRDYTFDEAATMQTAVALARKHAYALILMDIGLPDGDGRQASQAIRAIEHHQLTPIVAVTAHINEQEKAACLAGKLMQAVKYKPLSHVDITELKERYLSDIASIPAESGE